MAIYLKKFATQADYEAVQSSLILPNVSLIDETNGVEYNPSSPEPPSDPRLIATFNVTSTSESTKIIGDYADSPFSTIEIDGVVQPSVVSAYTFSTTGEHTVKYTLTDPTSIGYNAFNQCSGLTGVVIPNSVTSISNGAFSNCRNLTSMVVDSNNTVYDSRNNCNAIIETSTNALMRGCKNTVIPSSVTSIGNSAFYTCSDLTSIDIPSSVTNIGSSAFDTCSGLTSVTVNAVTPPTLGSYAFYKNASGRKIYVPSASVNAYKSASNWSNYAAYIEAIQ